jgi:diacylglycerol kinase
LGKSFKYAFKGFFKILNEEQNLRFQALAGLVVFILGVFFQISKIDWALLVISSSLVIVMEVVNSAVERVGDVLKPRLNGYVKEIKDIMAAAVMIASLAAIVVGAIVFYPYFIKLFL